MERTTDGEFVAEAESYIDALEREAFAWPSACRHDSVRRALRAMHTLKGAAGFMGEDAVEALAHALEELISPLSDETPPFVDATTLSRIANLTKALRRELGIHRPSASEEVPESKTRRLAGDALVALLRQGRRLAAEYGKHVQVCLGGTKVPLEHHLLETLRGPLGHIIRNAVAHAVESPKARAALGKPYFATIAIDVEEFPRELRVRVRDDGSGFDLAKLRRRVVARALATEDQARDMSTRELIELAFVPGVTTANEITSLCGRGVGLEAARATIEAAGGTFELSTEKDRGTTVLIRIPRTTPAAPPPMLKRAANHSLVR